MRLFQYFSHSKSRIFFWGQLAFIGGIYLAGWFQLPAFYLFVVVLVLALALIFIWSSKLLNWRTVLIIFIFFFFGWWRYQVSSPDFSDPAKIYFYNQHQTKFLATVVSRDERINQQKLTLETEAVLDGSQKSKISGQVLLTVPLYPKYSFGQKILVDCRLERPEVINDFDYGRYLSSYNVYSLCYRGDISDQGTSHDWSILLLRPLFEFRDSLSLALSETIAEPQNALLQALILNQRGGLDQAWMDKFSRTGVTHIIAISGSHLAMILSLLSVLAIAVGLRRQQAFWFATVAITLYLVLIGAPASAVRSAIMGLMVLLAQKLGRPTSPSRLLAFSAFSMLVLNPRLLIADVGFQLSFLSVAGLLYLYPLINYWWRRWPDKWQLKETLALTLSAQLATYPLIILYFRQLSLVAILANLLVLPVIPFLMISGFIQSLLGVFSNLLGRLVGYFSWLLASYFLLVIDYLAAWPLAAINIAGDRIFLASVISLVLIFVIIYFRRKIIRI